MAHNRPESDSCDMRLADATCERGELSSDLDHALEAIDAAALDA